MSRESSVSSCCAVVRWIASSVSGCTYSVGRFGSCLRGGAQVASVFPSLEVCLFWSLAYVVIRRVLELVVLLVVASVREALQRGGRRFPRLPRRDPAGAREHVAPDVAPPRSPCGARLGLVRSYT